MTYEQLNHLKPSAFKRRCGIHRETFAQIVEVLRPHLDRTGKRGGQCKLSVEDPLLVVLEYWREYRTQLHIATTWGLSESAVCRLIRKVETLLMHSGKFRLPGTKQLYQNANLWSVLFGKGRMHDFRVFKTHRIPMVPTQVCLADKGYQGIAKLHPCSCIPIKKPRKGKPGKAERRHNRILASVRVVAEHVNRKLKIFRILAERYRNRRKRFGLRVNLIAAIINFELALAS